MMFDEPSALNKQYNINFYIRPVSENVNLKYHVP